jgi:hypothetical protein
MKKHPASFRLTDAALDAQRAAAESVAGEVVLYEGPVRSLWCVCVVCCAGEGGVTCWLWTKPRRERRDEARRRGACRPCQRTLWRNTASAGICVGCCFVFGRVPAPPMSTHHTGSGALSREARALMSFTTMVHGTLDDWMVGGRSDVRVFGCSPPSRCTCPPCLPCSPYCDSSPLAPNNVNTMACAALAAHTLGFVAQT